MISKCCGVCGVRYPDSDDYFSSYTTSNGNPSRRGTCKSCMRAAAKRHAQKRPDLMRARAERRRSRVRAAKGQYTSKDILKIRKQLGDSCFYCGSALCGGGQVDHMTPVSKGGSNWPANLTLCCRTCNLDKHSKTAVGFIEWRQLHEKICSRRALNFLRKSRAGP